MLNVFVHNLWYRWSDWRAYVHAELRAPARLADPSVWQRSDPLAVVVVVVASVLLVALIWTGAAR